MKLPEPPPHLDPKLFEYYKDYLSHPNELEDFIQEINEKYLS